MADKPQIQKDLERDYKFAKNHGLYVNLSPNGGQGYAETFGPNEEGDVANNKGRPANFPIEATGIDIYRPNEFSHHDLAAELLHIDPVANRTREELKASLTDKQKEILESQPDYTGTISEGPVKGIKERALNNAVDAVMRGYVVGQWPLSAIKEMDFSKEQYDKLKNLHYYMVHGEDKNKPKLEGILSSGGKQ